MLFDEPLTIRGARRASATDPAGVRWTSEIEESDDPTRLITTLVPDDPAAASPSSFLDADPMTLHVDGQPVVRRQLAPDVKRDDVRDDGLVGTYFHRGDDTPGVVVLGGSGGGLSEGTAKMLASRGFSTLALAYFGTEHLPPHLVEIPIEYVVRGVRWLAARTGRVALHGISRGAELALLVASTYPDLVQAVVAVAPSSVVLSGLDPANPGGSAAWTLDGEPLPFAPSDPMSVNWTESPIALRPLFLPALSDQTSAIEVERFEGPILLLSGRDDQMGPTSDFGEQLARRGRDVRHLAFEGAGHSLFFPYQPTTVTAGRHSHMGTVFELGGTPDGNARAHVEGWRATLDFLKEAL